MIFGTSGGRTHSKTAGIMGFVAKTFDSPRMPFGMFQVDFFICLGYWLHYISRTSEYFSSHIKAKLLLELRSKFFSKTPYQKSPSLRYLSIKCQKKVEKIALSAVYAVLGSQWFLTRHNNEHFWKVHLISVQFHVKLIEIGPVVRELRSIYWGAVGDKRPMGQNFSGLWLYIIFVYLKLIAGRIPVNFDYQTKRFGRIVPQ